MERMNANMFSSHRSHFQLSITSPFSSPRNFPSLTTAQRSAAGGHGPAGPRGTCALRTGRGAPASSRSLSLTRKCPTPNSQPFKKKWLYDLIFENVNFFLLILLLCNRKRGLTQNSVWNTKALMASVKVRVTLGTMN